MWHLSNYEYRIRKSRRSHKKWRGEFSIFPRTDLPGFDPRHHPSHIKTIEIKVFRTKYDASYSHSQHSPSTSLGRGSQRDVVFLCWQRASASSYISPNAGGGGLRRLSQWAQLCTRSPKKLWRLYGGYLFYWHSVPFSFFFGGGGISSHLFKEKEEYLLSSGQPLTARLHWLITQPHLSLSLRNAALLVCLRSITSSKVHT